MIPVQYISDLHLDELTSYSTKDLLQPKSDILVMAGDICHIETVEQHHLFFKYVNENFQYALYIPGNHEFYSSSQTIDELEEELQQFLISYPNIIYLNNSSVIINNILFTGSCLWCNPQYDPPEWFLVQVSKRKIREMHQTSLDYLDKISSIHHPKHIIITHYPPMAIEKKRKLHFISKYDDYYQNSKIVLRFPPMLWIFGHVHENINIFVDSTLYASNQRKGKNYRTDCLYCVA